MSRDRGNGDDISRNSGDIQTETQGVGFKLELIEHFLASTSVHDD